MATAKKAKVTAAPDRSIQKRVEADLRTSGKREAKVWPQEPFPMHPHWRDGTANIVSREGRTYMTLSIDGQALDVPGDREAIAWFIVALQRFSTFQEEGLANKLTAPHTVEY